MREIMNNIGILGWLMMLSLQTFLLSNTDPYLIGIGWFVGALFLTLGVYYDLSSTDQNKQPKWTKIDGTKAKLLWILLYIVGFSISAYQLNQLFVENPIIAAQSDIIPSLKYYVQRLLSGEKVYTPMKFDGYDVLPTYFPMMWIPYIIPELVDLDYRWLPVITIYLVLSYLVYITFQKEENVVHVFLKALCLPIIILLFIKYDKSVFAYAVEFLPISYYIILFIGIYRKNWLLIGLGLGFSTMSRYAYTLWIIPFIWIIWDANGFKYLLKIGLTGMSVILFTYVIPFLLNDPNILLDGFKYYDQTVTSEWRVQSWQETNDIPYHINRGLSFSYYFFTLLEGDAKSKLEIAKLSQLLAAFTTVILIMIGYYKRNKLISWNQYLLISLFFYLVIFYSFIYVTFSYLFMLPLMIGLCLLIVYYWSNDNIFEKDLI